MHGMMIAGEPFREESTPARGPEDVRVARRDETSRQAEG